MRGVINFLAFYAGWFACVVGAAQMYLWIGPAVVVALVGLHLMFTAERRREGILILVVAGLGWCVDTGLASAGVYSFGARSIAPWVCPPWMVGLWAIFATTLNGSMSWLAGRYFLAALFGLIGGPMSYYYGARLGAIELSSNMTLSFGVLALAWAAATPLLVFLAERVGASRHPDPPALPPLKIAA